MLFNRKTRALTREVFTLTEEVLESNHILPVVEQEEIA